MRTLVVLLSETRSHEITYENIKKNLIDELSADLCLCIGVKPDYDYTNPFYQLAKHKFLYHEPADDPYFQKALEYAYRCTMDPNEPHMYERIERADYLNGKMPTFSIEKMGRSPEEMISDLEKEHDFDCYVDDGTYLHTIKEKDNSNYVVSEKHTTYKRRLHYRDFWELRDKIGPDPAKFTNFAVSTGIHMFFTWFLWKNIKEYGLLEQYDRFVITRSDFVYQLPHPKLELLNPGHIWIPDGEHHYGVCDRHAVLSPQHVEKYLDIVTPFFKKSNEYYMTIRNRDPAHIGWNMEQLLKMSLEKRGVADKVVKFPYVMYCVRSKTGVTRWSDGDYSEELGYFIKYMDEYKKSSYFKAEFDKSGLDINTFYKVYGWL